MKQKRVLGSVPRGLQWIEDIVESPELAREVQQTPELPQEQSQTVAPEPVVVMHQEAQAPAVSIKSSHEGLASGWTRATFIVQEEHLEKLKAVAYWERLTLKEVVAEIFAGYLKDKQVKPVCKAKKFTL